MFFLICLTILMLTGLILSPDTAISGAKEGLVISAEIIIPALFPFFVCAKILTDSGIVKKWAHYLSFIMRPLFNVPGCSAVAFVLGILSGYPLGAKCVVDMYEKNLCTKTEAERTLCFCNNSGPIFIIGAVGVGMFCSKEAGILLYVIHILSAIILGLLMKGYKRNEKVSKTMKTYEIEVKKNMGTVFSDSVKDSVLSCLGISGFIVFFSVFLSLANRFGILSVFVSILKSTNMSDMAANTFCSGFFELTSGCAKVAALPSMPIKIVIASVILAWSGLSVILQTAGIIAKSGLSVKVFVFAKMVQGLIAAVLSSVLCRLPIDVATFSDGFSKPLEVWFEAGFMLFGGIIFLMIFIGFSIILRNLLKLNNKYPNRLK